MDFRRLWRRKAVESEGSPSAGEDIPSPGQKAACHCSGCGFTWQEAIGQPESPAEAVHGLQCSACARVFCAKCLGALDLRLGACPCRGGTLSEIIAPNGSGVESETVLEEEELPYLDRGGELDLHLYFGYTGEVPIAIDASLPVTPFGLAADHVRWAEQLIDSGLYYHADRELAYAGAPSARAMWLRARLLIVRLRNGRENSRRHTSDRLTAPEWSSTTRIADLLRAAVTEDPRLGGAWLTAAVFALAEDRTAEGLARALEYAEHASALLGRKHTASLLVLGKAQAANRRFEEAIATFGSIPLDSAESAEAVRESQQADLARRAQMSPPDLAACWQLGRRLISDRQLEAASDLFERLAEQMPERPEGHCGLGRLALLDYGLPAEQRVTRAHELCQRALVADERFGPAHELMGMVISLGRANHVELPSGLSESAHNHRAVELDPASDIALAALADEAIERGDADEAFDLLKGAAALGTKLEGVYFNLAVFYQAKREPEKQAEAYRRAKELAPALDLAAEYKNRLLDMCGFEY